MPYFLFCRKVDVIFSFEFHQKKDIIGISYEKEIEYMARVSSTFLKHFEPIKASSLREPVVFVIDMINGFIKTGALHDEAILSCVAPIQTILQEVKGPSVFVADAHPMQTREFQSFPSHCTEGSEESDVIDELQPYVETLFHKNSTNAFFSPEFQAFLEKNMPHHQDVVIVGCCSDICILQFALSLNAYFNEHNVEDKRILLPVDAIDTYHIEHSHDAVLGNEFSIANMYANGIQVVLSINKG